MRRNFFLSFLFLSQFLAQAQEADFILSKFFATQVEDEVLLRWTIEKGNTCEDTYVQRSEDGISFEQIGLIGGICGSPDASITYDFYDTLPLPNRTSYYRLMLGQYGFTSPELVEFVRYNDKGFLLAPNPFDDITRLRFDNGKGEDFVILIYDYQGRKILEMKTSGDEFIIRKEILGPGLYIYRVIKGGNVIFDGKILAL